MLVLISYILSLIFLSLLKKHFFIKKKIVIFIIVYLIIIIVHQLYDYYLIYKLDSFDLDGDGIFGGKEINLEQQLAMDAVVNDTARIFIWFTGIVYALLYIFFSQLQVKYIISIILIGITFLSFNFIGSYKKRINKMKQFSQKNNIVQYKNLLMYQDNIDVISVKRTWIYAKQYCHDLILLDYKDWRLPSVSELYNITDSSCGFNIIPPFKYIYPDEYWTSEIQDNNYIWVINFRNKSKYFVFNNEKHLVRCVRKVDE